MSKSTNAKTVSTKPATGLANMAAQITQAVTANVSAGTVARRPAVGYEHGKATVTTADGKEQVATLHGALAKFDGSLPATNPANRGTIGNVKNAAGKLVAGNGKGPRAGHNLVMFSALLAALPCTQAQAAEATGSAAFVMYAIKHGWVTSK